MYISINIYIYTFFFEYTPLQFSIERGNLILKVSAQLLENPMCANLSQTTLALMQSATALFITRLQQLL